MSVRPFDLQWPMNVTDPDKCRLTRYAKLPSHWTTRSPSGFDTFLVESDQYPGINHNLDKAVRCASYPTEGTRLGPDALPIPDGPLGLYYATWPWLREFVNVNRLGPPTIKLWAYDHLCLLGWRVPLPTTDDRSFIY